MKIPGFIRNWLTHPLLRGIGRDEARITDIRRRIVLENCFLRRIYETWYAQLNASLPEGPKPVVEIGSGGGFLDRFVHHLLKSDIFFCPFVDLILDGLHMPFADGSLRGIVMTDVLHHIPEPKRFLTEAARCVQPQGVMTMIEPWVTPWSRLVYTHLHHEPFDAQAANWEAPAAGPLAGANGALPWIIFERDEANFRKEFPQWKLEAIELEMPFRYLVSGGVSFRPLMPGWSFKPWTAFERLLSYWMTSLAMFAHITLRRIQTTDAKIQTD